MNQPPMLSPRRAFASAPGRPISAGASPVVLMITATVRMSMRSSA
jgi:hypothetical protein